jgi:hypothetical protein
MIIARLVKELFIVFVILVVILRCSDLEVGNPGELSIYVSLLTSQRGPGRHSGASNCVFLVRVQSLLWLVRNDRLLLVWLVEVLLFSFW